jgi:hypothetical protein
MFLFRPKLPVSESAREVVDRALAWFTELWSEETLQSVPVILPTPEFFPDPWETTDEHAQAVFDRICGYMGIPVERVRLELFRPEDPMQEIRHSLPHWEEHSSGAAGVYLHRKPGEEAAQLVIRIDARGLASPQAYIATAAHELGHVLLLGDERLPRDAEHMEPMTDLVTVFWGLGIFGANSAFQYHTTTEGTSHGWSFRRLGYLSEEAWGYALARWASLRGDWQPDWSRYLARNVQHYLRQSARVLESERRAT